MGDKICFIALGVFLRADATADKSIKIEAPKIPTKINIVFDSDFRGLIDYSKGENSPPREAMIILLMFLFGLTTADGIGATLSVTDTSFEIVLTRIPRSCGRHSYNREHILKLPNSPIWLKDLKERFLKQWNTEYAKAKKRLQSRASCFPQTTTIDKCIARQRCVKSGPPHFGPLAKRYQHTFSNRLAATFIRKAEIPAY